MNAIYEGMDQVATSILLSSPWTYDASIALPACDLASVKAGFAAAEWTDSN